MSRKKERNLNLLKIKFESIENSLFIYFILFLFDLKNFFISLVLYANFI